MLLQSPPPGRRVDGKGCVCVCGRINPFPAQALMLAWDIQSACTNGSKEKPSCPLLLSLCASASEAGIFGHRGLSPAWLAHSSAT